MKTTETLEKIIVNKATNTEEGNKMHLNTEEIGIAIKMLQHKKITYHTQSNQSDEDDPYSQNGKC